MGNVDAVEAYSSSVWPLNPHYQLYYCRFARPVGSNQSEDFTGPDGEAQVLNCNEAPKALVQVTYTIADSIPLSRLSNSLIRSTCSLSVRWTIFLVERLNPPLSLFRFAVLPDTASTR